MPTQKSIAAASSRKSSSVNLSDMPSTGSDSGSAQEKSGSKMHKRSRSGCFTCRLRRKKCDEGHPSCKACTNLSVKCEYKRPMWWGNPEQRRIQKERIKNKIKQTKSLERSGTRPDGLPHSHISLSSPGPGETDFNQPIIDGCESFGLHFATPGFVPISYAHYYTPYEVDIKTERQTFVNNVPLRHDSSISTFSAMGPPQLHSTLPTFPAEDWFQEEMHIGDHGYGLMNGSLSGESSGQSYASLTADIPVADHDRPLLNHFVENVLRMIFPVLEAHQQGSTRAQSVLKSLETNKSYFHCCLSVAAIHLKTTTGLGGEQIDHDIMRHRYEAISQLCQALSNDTDHDQILDATLAMIFFHCSVGSPEDHLPDIPWNDHFQAVSNLVTKLDLTNTMVPCANGYVLPPFSMSLTAWIDILGSTMLGKTPQFAHSYRNKHLGGSSSGLRELMGCDDRVMYLISEIACLESLKNEGRIDAMTVCTHVSALGNQLEYTEPADPTLESPYCTATGAIRPDVLTKNITTLFRLAARVYLCSLIPGTSRAHSSICNLIDSITDTLAFIPTGPGGFDRSLVWPLLIAGAHSTPSSSFRQALTERMLAMEEFAELGSFGRMCQLLNEYWRLTDDCIEISSSQQDQTTQVAYDNHGTTIDTRSSPPLLSPTMRELKKQQLHWRDVMNRNGWRHLLI
ncbi:hypothetical protein N7539_006555 [Penicillium diatomitis]|uniref:Zn(2)-C6 fungal-type domain-containing protein n=1 Tax=Penicillium diatomitis TaxID=2819901 RepID=A0A9W9X2M3_9EURO|nr:uncharacterized protein N7539_006555 [Penicillium diatomitis]KAJ5480661.1 hypothetical protein N7539_006555 [Penicillium diatomitis]